MGWSVTHLGTLLFPVTRKALLGELEDVSVVDMFCCRVALYPVCMCVYVCVHTRMHVSGSVCLSKGKREDY